MQNLKQRLTALKTKSLKEWFANHPKDHQFRLMLSKNNLACFVRDKQGVRLEMAPGYLDEQGIPRRESYVIRNDDGTYSRMEAILMFYEKETHRKYLLKGETVLSFDAMEDAFTKAEEAFEKEKDKGFRPCFLFDYVEFYKFNEKGEKR